VKREVYKIKMDTGDEWSARILDAAACIQESEDQLRRTTRDLRTGVAKCVEVGGGDFGTFIVYSNSGVPRNFVRGGVQQINLRTEDRENG